MQIDIHDETEVLTEELFKLVEELLQKAAESENIEVETEVSVTFVDDQTIQEINREYRQKDRPTDVISFALNDDDSDIIHDDAPNLLGDIIVSVPRAKAQALEYGHSFNRELGFLVVHGFLHLLGYDHMNEADEKEMFSKQENILAAYGLSK